MFVALVDVGSPGLSQNIPKPWQQHTATSFSVPTFVTFASAGRTGRSWSPGVSTQGPLLKSRPFSAMSWKPGSTPGDSHWVMGVMESRKMSKGFKIFQDTVHTVLNKPKVKLWNCLWLKSLCTWGSQLLACSSRRAFLGDCADDDWQTCKLLWHPRKMSEGNLPQQKHPVESHTHTHAQSQCLLPSCLWDTEHIWTFCMVLSFSCYTVWCQTWDPAWPTRQGKILDSHLCTGVAWDQQMQPLRHKRVYDVLHSTAPRWPDLSKIVLTWCWLRCFISYTQHILSETLKCAHPASCGGSHGLDTRSTSLCQRQSSTSFGNLHVNVLLRWWKTWQPTTDPQAQNKSHHSSSQKQRFCVDLFLSFPF